MSMVRILNHSFFLCDIVLVHFWCAVTDLTHKIRAVNPRVNSWKSVMAISFRDYSKVIGQNVVWSTGMKQLVNKLLSELAAVIK